MTDFPFKNEPSDIQLSAMKKAYPKRGYALYHAMGAGKTFTSINVAAARKMTGKIQHAIVIVNPGAIKDVWDVELEKHCPVEYDFHIYKAGGQKSLGRWLQTRDEKPLHWLIYGVEAFSQGKAVETLASYIRAYKDEGIMMIIDEATSIKTPSAARTKKLIKYGQECDYRMILTGTPITQGYQDLFAQFKFLHSDIIGCKSYVLFRNKYCIMGGFEGRKIIGYQWTDDLMQRIAPYCDIVSKEEAMPYLKPKQYLPDLIVEPTKEQRTAMDTLKEQFAASDGGEILTVSTVMERITRYQQICGGFFPFDDVENGGYQIKPISGKNPKLIALMTEMELLYEQNEKVIIWARFIPEIEIIRDTLRAKFGEKSTVDFYGGTAEADRKGNTKRFQEDPECKFIVSTQAVGGKGQTWTASTQTRYYSQTFSYEDRMQSEDRNHRRGQENSVGYRNLVMNVAADHMVAIAIAKKHDVSEEFKDGIGSIDLGAAY